MRREMGLDYLMRMLSPLEPMRREMGLDYFMRMYILSPRINNFLKTACHSHLFSNSLTFP